MQKSNISTRRTDRAFLPLHGAVSLSKTNPTARSPRGSDGEVMPANRECVLTTSRPPRCHYGSLEQTIHAIRAHRPFDLNAVRWREAHPGADFETWRPARPMHVCTRASAPQTSLKSLIDSISQPTYTTHLFRPSIIPIRDNISDP